MKFKTESKIFDVFFCGTILYTLSSAGYIIYKTYGIIQDAVISHRNGVEVIIPLQIYLDINFVIKSLVCLGVINLLIIIYLIIKYNGKTDDEIE